MALKKRELKKLKDKIMAEKERVINSTVVNDTEQIFLDAGRGKDEVDLATSEYERSQVLRFKKRDRLYAKKLNKALHKIELGEYGICEDCGCDIKFERLNARPTAELCITCKDEAEKEEQGNFVARQSKSMSQTIQLGRA